MTGLAGSGVQVSAKRRGYRLTAGVLLVMMLGGTLPVPPYVLYEKQMGFGPLGVTVVFAAYVAGTLFALVALGDLSDHIGPRRCWHLARGPQEGEDAAVLGTAHLAAPRCTSPRRRETAGRRCPASPPAACRTDTCRADRYEASSAPCSAAIRAS